MDSPLSLKDFEWICKNLIMGSIWTIEKLAFSGMQCDNSYFQVLLEVFKQMHDFFEVNQNAKIRLRNLDFSNNPQITDAKLWKLIFNHILSMGKEHLPEVPEDEEEKEAEQLNQQVTQ